MKKKIFDELFVKDEKEAVEKWIKSKDIKVKALIKRGIKVVRNGGVLVDVISTKGEIISNNEKNEILSFAIDCVALRNRLKMIKKKK